MNSIYDPIITSIKASAIGANNNVISAFKSGDTDDADSGSLNFPTSFTNDSGINERPWWRGFWGEYYQYYTVLGCEWEFVIRNARGGTRPCLVAWEYDNYNGASATGNILPDMDISKLMGQKGINYQTIPPSSIDKIDQYETIKGTWHPGMAKRNIQNDADYKTWTAQGSAPTLVESLHMRFYPHPLTGIAVNASAGSGVHHCNVQLRVKYLVQWKDLEESARYPYSTGQTALQTNIPTDVLPTYAQT